MTTKNKELTQLVKSMKKNLLSGHAINVPYSALKACFLQANGEHPHAFGSKDKLLTELAEQKALVAQAPAFFSPEHDFDGKKLAWLQKAGMVQPTRTVKSTGPGYTLHLVDDESGCLARLAMDAEGKYLVPEGWAFPQSAQVLTLSAEIPNVQKYGFPDYLDNPSVFFLDNLGLALSLNYSADYDDLGDDSGDSAVLTVALEPADWLQLVKAVEIESPALKEALGDWVELPGMTIGDMPVEKQALCLEYLKMVSTTDRFTELAPVVFEWVYPDEDSDSRSALVNMETGVILIAEHQHELESLGVLDPTVRTRLLVDVDNWDFDGAIIPVYRIDDETGRGFFKLTKKGLVALNTLLLERD